MSKYKIIIQGGKSLHGSVKIAGAKNAALPELAAAVLSSDNCVFENIPDVTDIRVMLRALENVGARGDFKEGKVDVRLQTVSTDLIPPEIVQTSRASILLLGPLLARHGSAKVSLPGGCPIGDRKFDYHLGGLRKMGAHLEISGCYIIGSCSQLQAIDYTFPGKTVTGTENLMMAASLAKGTTILRNCAAEPEVIDLAGLLNQMGARVELFDQDSYLIEGKTSLGGVRHRIISDRIEAGTYVIAGCFGNNRIDVDAGNPEYISSLLQVLKQMGADIEVSQNMVRVSGCPGLRPADIVTEPFPGFPTDLQAQLTTLLTQSSGQSRVTEKIFNNRFQHTGELNRMGADIQVQGDTALIRGKTPLSGATLRATDLRASAALILGGLIARGETVIENADQLFRGYENMPQKLLELGADIKVEGGMK